MNERDKQVLANGDIGQGDYLVEAKQKAKKTNNKWYSYLIVWSYKKLFLLFFVFYDRNVADKIYNIGDWSDVMLMNEKYDVKIIGVFERVLYGEQNRLYEF